MFKTIMKNLKTTGYRALTIVKKAVIILLIEALILAAIPVNAAAIETTTTITATDEQGIILGQRADVPLILSYAIDTKDNTFIFNWNREIDNTKYLVLTRNSGELTYELACQETGITDTYLTLNLDTWKNRYFLVCEKDAAVISGDRYIVTDYSKASNQVYADESSTQKPSRPVYSGYVKDGSEAELSWTMPYGNAAYFLVYEKSVSHGGWYYMESDMIHADVNVSTQFSTRYYVWAVNTNGNTSNPMIYENIGTDDGGIGDAGTDGIYYIDPTSDTVMEYEGVKLEIPAGAAPEGTAIAMNTLGFADIPEIDENESTNVTYAGDNTGLYGYDIYFNGSENTTFSQNIEITLRYDRTKIPQGMSDDDVYVCFTMTDRRTNGAIL